MSTTLDNLNTHPTRQHPTDQKLVVRRQSPPGENTTPTYDRRLLLVLELIDENMQRQLMIRELCTARYETLSSTPVANQYGDE